MQDNPYFFTFRNFIRKTRAARPEPRFLNVDTLRKIVLGSIFFAGSAAFAQSGLLQPKPLKFPAPAYNVQAVVPAGPFSFSKSGAHSPAAFDPAVHYPAFFCRMELKSVSRLGIRIKVHAGDYDAYSRPALQD